MPARANIWKLFLRDFRHKLRELIRFNHYRARACARGGWVNVYISHSSRCATTRELNIFKYRARKHRWKCEIKIIKICFIRVCNGRVYVKRSNVSPLMRKRENSRLSKNKNDRAQSARSHTRSTSSGETRRRRREKRKTYLLFAGIWGRAKLAQHAV